MILWPNIASNYRSARKIGAGWDQKPKRAKAIILRQIPLNWRNIGILFRLRVKLNPRDWEYLSEFC